MEENRTADRSSAFIPSFEFVKIPCIVFRPTGIRFTEDQRDKSNFTRGPMYYVSVIGLVWCISCETVFAVLAASRGQADFRQNMYIICCVFCLSLAFYFCVKVLLDKRMFVHVAEKFEECFPETINEQRKFRVASCVKQANFNILLYTAIQMISITGFNSFPQIEILLVYFRDHRWEVDFLFPLWYPFDPYVRGVFEFCYFFEIFTSTVCIFLILSFDMVMCVWVEQLCMHLTQLKRAFNDFNSSDGDKNAERAFISKHIQKHWLTLELADKLDEIFSLKILLNFLMSAILICATGFLVMVSETIVENLKYFFMLVLWMSQIYFVCYLGDRVTVACAGVSDGAHAGEWYNHSITYQRALLALHTRCQRDVYLTAYKFSDVTMGSFASIVSTSWKFLTLLNTMYKK